MLVEVENYTKNVVEENKGGFMKKILLGLTAILIFVSCSSSNVKKETLVEKYSLDKNAAKNWEETISGVIIGEAEIPDWFGEENPLMNLRRHGRMSDKDLYFLEALGKTPVDQITDDDYKKFLDILTGYVNKLPRRFILDNTNIKDPKGLVDYMVKSANSQFDNPSKYIKEAVADEYEWGKIVELSKKSDLTTKDVRTLRKILNNFMKRENFFNPQVWFNQEISERVIQVRDLSKKSAQKTKIEQNNINAKAMYIAYPGFFSKLDRWNR